MPPYCSRCSAAGSHAHLLTAIALALLGACDARPKSESTGSSSAGMRSASSRAKPPAASAASASRPAERPTASVPSAAALDAGTVDLAADAGANAGAATIDPDCHVLRPATPLGKRAQVSLAFRPEAGLPGEPAILLNARGKPSPQPLAPPAAATGDTGLLPPPSSTESLGAACAVAGPFVYCMDADGGVHRRRLGDPGADAKVADAIPGSAIAAAALGEHSVLAYLAPRKTSEGLVSHAFAVLDEGSSVQISEDGSGATAVAIAPRQGELLALYVDARVALTPVHLRVLRVGAALEPGRDAVVLMAGGSDRWQTGALATTATGLAHALVPTTTEDGGYGLAVVPVAGEPADDMPIVWSRYPGPLHPAPVVATQGRAPVVVARVRPVDGSPGARHLLELGHLADSGAFREACPVAESAGFQHVALAAGEGGSLWIAYTTADGTWIAERGPAP